MWKGHARQWREVRPPALGIDVLDAPSACGAAPAAQRTGEATYWRGQGGTAGERSAVLFKLPQSALFGLPVNIGGLPVNTGDRTARRAAFLPLLRYTATQGLHTSMFHFSEVAGTGGASAGFAGLRCKRSGRADSASEAGHARAKPCPRQRYCGATQAARRAVTFNTSMSRRRLAQLRNPNALATVTAAVGTGSSRHPRTQAASQEIREFVFCERSQAKVQLGRKVCVPWRAAAHRGNVVRCTSVRHPRPPSNTSAWQETAACSRNSRTGTSRPVCVQSAISRCFEAGAGRAAAARSAFPCALKQAIPYIQYVQSSK